MSSLPPVHIAIMQPAGYVHSLAFVDTARYARWQFRRMGAEVTLGKNRLREDRPIDLLFFGSMNPRRRAFIDRVESHGLQVSMFDHAIYDAERDHFIRQAKAVINCHFYESSRFEQVRAFHCLSLGTPVIS